MYQEYLNQLQVSISPLASEELKDLLNDDDKLDEKVDEVLEVLRVQKTSLFEENRIKAERNIDKEPQIIELRGKVNELAQQGRTLCESVQGKLQQIKEKSGNVSQETALALLQTAAAESEEHTEVLVNKFTNNEVSVEAFLEEFLTTRKTMHLRKLKTEKMQELMRKQQQQHHGGGGASPATGYGNRPASSGFYPAPAPLGSSGSNVPYPVNPMMPMPPMPRPY